MNGEIMNESHAPFGAHSLAADQIIDFVKWRRSNRASRGHLLLSGLSGTGKSRLVQRVCEHLSLPFATLSCSEIFDAETGASERKLAALFHQNSPQLIILDNFDVIGGGSGGNGTGCALIWCLPLVETEARVLSVLKYLLDGLAGASTVVIGITSRPDAIDAALVRGGRLSQKIHLSISTLSQRRSLLEEIISEAAVDPLIRPVLLTDLAKRTHGFTIADLHNLATRAVEKALQRGDSSGSDDANACGNLQISADNFISAVKENPPSIISDLPTVVWPSQSPTSVLVGLDHIKKEIVVRLTGSSS